MMEDEATLRDSIERYRQILRGIADERVSRELERMIREIDDKLREIERQREKFDG
ncbi:MAG: hypothetical protein ACLQJR_18035 [Stellaceae bacterium]